MTATSRTEIGEATDAANKPGDQDIHESELDLLREVMVALKDLGVRVWLDQGSLLGAVRDGRFLPLAWDEDVDLGVWKRDLKKVFPEFAKRLRVAGARVDFPPGSGTMMIRPTKSIGGRPVNVGAYRRKGSHVEKKAALIRENVEPPRNLLKRAGRVVFPRILRVGRWLIRRGLADSREDKDLRAALRYNLGAALNQVGLYVRYFSHKRIRFRTDSVYFEAFEDFEIYGMKFLVPKDSRGYLRCKYGEDWHIPKKEWVFWEQDGAITTEETAGG